VGVDVGDDLGEAAVPAGGVAQVVDDAVKPHDPDGLASFVVDGEFAVHHQAVRVLRGGGISCDDGDAGRHDRLIALDVEVRAVF
jgi:hypothetical protein